MSSLTLEQAIRIAEASLKTAREMALKPLTVAILDSGGHMVAFMREDDSGILRPEMATAKAYGSLGLGMGSRGYMDREMQFLGPLAAVSQGRMFPMPGGVLVRSADDNSILGAVGASGDTGDNDEAAIIAGIQSIGLIADTGGA
jgi:uncharacterized protein GlcG (DUF336 family)